MKYVVRSNTSTDINQFGSLRDAKAFVEATEAYLVGLGHHVVGYDLQPKVKKADMKYGRVVYTSWEAREWLPLVWMTEYL